MTKLSDRYTFERLITEIGAMRTGPYEHGQDFALGMMILRGVTEVIKDHPDRAEEVLDHLAPQLARPGGPLIKELFHSVHCGLLDSPKEIREAALERFLSLAWPVLAADPERENTLVFMTLGQAGVQEVSNLVLPCLRFVDRRAGTEEAERLAQRLGEWVLSKVLGLGHELPPDDSHEVMEGFLEFADLSHPLRPSGDGKLVVSWERALGELLLTADEYGYADDEEQNRWVIATLVRSGLNIDECARFVGEYGPCPDGGGHDDPGRFSDVMGWLLEAGASWKKIEPSLPERARALVANHPIVRQERLTEIADQAPAVRATRRSSRM